jgi:hypothetical protein
VAQYDLVLYNVFVLSTVNIWNLSEEEVRRQFSDLLKLLRDGKRVDEVLNLYAPVCTEVPEVRQLNERFWND